MTIVLFGIKIFEEDCVGVPGKFDDGVSLVVCALVDVSIVYSKLTAVADEGKLLSSVKQQHFTRSRPFSLPPQLLI